MALMVGVSGIRGIIGQTMTPTLAVDAGLAFAAHVGSGRIVVARDSRRSGEMVLAGVTAGLLAGGCDVVDLGIVTTPSAALMVRELAAAGGIVATASHNPIAWNGIKYLTTEGGAPSRAVAERILSRFKARDFTCVPVERIGRLSHDDSSDRRHVNRVLSIVQPEKVSARRFKVVLDSVHGAGGRAGRMLLEALGCRVEHLYAEPTGDFPHTPEPLAENLTELAEATRRLGAAIGFAQDPDADRLAVIDENGRYIGEEYTLALAARYIFATRPGPAVANLSTSRMIDDIAARCGGKCVVRRSPVGEANVVEVMRATNAVIGGEGNGGVIDPRVVYVRDSLTAMALVLQLMADDNTPLSRVADALPRWRMIKLKFECAADKSVAIVAAVRTKFAGQKVSDLDGVRIDWPEGWVHVRGSNTEPIIRVIAEAADERAAEALVARVRPIIDAGGRTGL